MAPKVDNTKYTKSCKVLSRSGKNLECFKCNKSLHLKCSRLDKKRFLKYIYIQGNLKFVNFVQITPVTTVINMFTTGKKLSYVMAVRSGLMKNVLDLQ